MALNFIDELAVKRVTNGDELESTTLRSDLVARYLFLNETLLQGLSVLKTTQGTKDGLGLRETIVDDEGEMIKDETTYLQGMVAQLEKEVANLKNHKKEHQTLQSKEYDSILKSLDNKNLSDEELNKLQERWTQLSHKHIELKEMPVLEKEEQQIQPGTNSGDMGLDLGVDLRGLEDVDVSEMLGEMVDL